LPLWENIPLQLKKQISDPMHKNRIGDQVEKGSERDIFQLIYFLNLGI
jgi:hypothetical protein